MICTILGGEATGPVPVDKGGEPLSASSSEADRLQCNVCSGLPIARASAAALHKLHLSL